MSPRAAAAAKPKATTDPHAIAHVAVDRFFQAMIASRDATAEGCWSTASLDQAFIETQDAVKAAYVREHGPIKDGDDLVDEQCAQEAGYLVGVQVGLRLRSVGGMQ